MPAGGIPCAIFTNFAEFVPRFRARWVLKFGWICSRGYGVMGVLSWWGLVTPNFQRPLAAKVCVKPKNVLEVEERARGPLSPCQVWWGSDFTRRRDSHKRCVFFVCLSVCSSRFCGYACSLGGASCSLCVTDLLFQMTSPVQMSYNGGAQ